jgi:DNA-binding NtrC family response regulator
MSSEVASKRLDAPAFATFSPNAIGDAPVFRALLHLIDRVAPTDHALLVSGPTGAGKEVVAQLVHHRRRQPGAPFVDLNCGALPEHLVESELFGHVKGAFTGANSDHPGLFGIAGRGTVFLDEIGELPLALQPKLLRVLETRSFRPVGAAASRRFEGRVIAASHRDLVELVRQGRFREDLYYRLAVFVLDVPGLDQRRDDIPLLAQHFAALQPRALRFTSDALERLREHAWPGNVRQLRNLIDRIGILSDASVITTSILDEFLAPAKAGPLPEALFESLLALDGENKLDAAEQLLIDFALKRTQGSKTAAAALLGVHRKVIERRLVARDRQRGVLAEALEQARALVDEGKLREAIEPLRRGLGQSTVLDAQSEMRALRFEAHRLLAVCLRAVHGWLSAEAQAEQEAALSCGEGVVEPAVLNSLQFGMWSTQLMTMQLAQARATAQQMLRRAQGTREPAALAEAYAALANTTFWLADFAEVLACLEQGGLLPPPEHECRGTQSFDLRGLAVTFAGLAAFQSGAFERARSYLHWLIDETGREGQAPFAAAIVLQGVAWLAFLFDDMPTVGTYADRLVALSIEHEFPFYRGVGQVFLGCHLAAQGDHERAEAEMAQGFEQHMLRHGGKLFHSFQAWQRGKALLAGGQHERARVMLDAAIDTALEHQDRAYLGELLCEAGLARLAAGDLEGAEDGLRSALSTARALGSVPARVRAATELAQLLAQRNRNTQAADLLAQTLAGIDTTIPFPGLARALDLARSCQEPAIHTSRQGDALHGV